MFELCYGLADMYLLKGILPAVPLQLCKLVQLVIAVFEKVSTMMMGLLQHWNI